MKRTRTAVTCALPGCGKQFELTPYQIAHHTLPPTCSRKHARILRSLQGIRQDDAGPFLQALVIDSGGVGETVKRLRKGSEVTWNRTSLQLLMRTKGRIPRAAQLKDLARATRKPGELPDQALGRAKVAFGSRIDRRTATIIDTARKIPRDPVRTAVANRIEREHKTVRAYAAAVSKKTGTDVTEEPLRLWLIGKQQGLAEPVLRTVIQYEHLRPSKKWIENHSSKANRQRAAARGRRKLLRRKHRHYSDHMREALSGARREMWKPGSEWRRNTGKQVISKMLNGWRRIKSSEADYLEYLIRRAVGHFRKYHSTATPQEALRVLVRIIVEHRRQFPKTTIRFEDLPQKVEQALGESLRTALHVEERLRLHDVNRIAEIIRVLAKASARRWEVAAASQDSSAETTREFWRQTRKSLGPGLLERLVMAVLGDASGVQIVLSRKSGRPSKAPLTV